MRIEPTTRLEQNSRLFSIEIGSVLATTAALTTLFAVLILCACCPSKKKGNTPDNPPTKAEKSKLQKTKPSRRIAKKTMMSQKTESTVLTCTTTQTETATTNCTRSQDESFPTVFEMRIKRQPRKAIKKQQTPMTTPKSSMLVPPIYATTSERRAQELQRSMFVTPASKRKIVGKSNRKFPIQLMAAAIVLASIFSSAVAKRVVNRDVAEIGLAFLYIDDGNVKPNHRTGADNIVDGIVNNWPIGEDKMRVSIYEILNPFRLRSLIDFADGGNKEKVRATKDKLTKTGNFTREGGRQYSFASHLRELRNGTSSEWAKGFKNQKGLRRGVPFLVVLVYIYRSNARFTDWYNQAFQPIAHTDRTLEPVVKYRPEVVAVFESGTVEFGGIFWRKENADVSVGCCSHKSAELAQKILDEGIRPVLEHCPLEETERCYVDPANKDDCVVELTYKTQPQYFVADQFENICEKREMVTAKCSKDTDRQRCGNMTRRPTTTRETISTAANATSTTISTAAEATSTTTEQTPTTAVIVTTTAKKEGSKVMLIACLAVLGVALVIVGAVLVRVCIVHNRKQRELAAKAKSDESLYNAPPITIAKLDRTVMKATDRSTLSTKSMAQQSMAQQSMAQSMAKTVQKPTMIMYSGRTKTAK